MVLLKGLGIGFVCRAHAAVHGKVLKELKEANEDRHLNIEAGPKPYQRKRVKTSLKILPTHDESYEYSLRFIRDNDFILVTNLLKETGFKKSDLKYLYSTRWGAETHYRSIKVDTLLENFSGKKLLANLQDIHATILVQNLARILEYDLCEKERDLKERYHPNHREVLGFIKLAVSQLYEKGITALKMLMTFIQPKWERIKHGRSYPRNLAGHREKNRLKRLCYA